MQTIKSVIFLVLAATLGLNGCGTTKPTSFYLLQPIAETPAGATGAESSVAIGIGPIELPRYLDRPQVVTRGSGNQLQVAEYVQWGEPLKDNVTRVLGENLSNLLPTDRVELFPWRRADNVDYQVTLEMSQFEGVLGADSILSARWQIVDGRTRKALLARKSTISVKPHSVGHSGTVAAMNEALSALSKEINFALHSIRQ